MEILHQLADLFISAIPTIIIAFLFYLFLRSTFFKPMERVLAERHARIEGAQREAIAAQEAAQEKLRSYEEALRKIRSEIYAQQEAIRRAALDERVQLTRETRNRSNEQVRAAKDRIAKELAAAEAELERESQPLAIEIVRAVLERASPPGMAKA